MTRDNFRPPDEDSGTFEFLAILALAVFVALVAACAQCEGRAPAPFARRSKATAAAKPLVGAGRYRMTWGGRVYAVTLGSDGSYAATADETRWVGSWGVRGGRFCITESARPQDALSWQTYTVEMDRAGAGRTVEGTEQPVPVRLERIGAVAVPEKVKVPPTEG